VDLKESGEGESNLLKFSFNYELFFKGTFLTINIKKFDSIAIEFKQ
jgi:hypothetical protein